MCQRAWSLSLSCRVLVGWCNDWDHPLRDLHRRDTVCHVTYVIRRAKSACYKGVMGCRGKKWIVDVYLCDCLNSTSKNRGPKLITRWCVTTPSEHIFLTHSVVHFLISIEGWHLHNHIIKLQPTPPPISSPLTPSFFLPLPLVSVQNNLIPGEDLSGGWEKELCVEVGDEGRGTGATQHNTPHQLHYFLTGLAPITSRTEIMCADSSPLLWKHYAVCEAANLFAAPQRSSSTAVHGEGTANRERSQANCTTAGMNETEKVCRRGGTMGGVQKLFCSYCWTQATLLNDRRQGYYNC